MAKDDLIFNNPEIKDYRTDYGKGLEPKIDPRTDFGKGLFTKVLMVVNMHLWKLLNKQTKHIGIV